jgi:hypothetical protein
MDIQTLNQSQVIVEVASHFVQLIGWPALVMGAWKFRGWLNEAEDNFAQKLDKMTDNHLHHIQESMQVNAEAMKSVASELKELRNDIRLAPFKRD